ncbi:hypothetical protein FOL47_010497 [Perkinsus chesapeaki]|uniref:C2H2-type domain-containing protein n=1 Tax=Perkinsus chesapeaki TaxID=330153 RepID=A0A7J6L2V6_PERCH|nr:hypothetical protein FOL47_010497 [Perkinsus chesapeaki]
MGLGVFTLFGIVYPINFFLALTAVKVAVSRSILDILRVTFPKQLVWFNNVDIAVGCIGLSLLMAYGLVSVTTGIQAMSSEGYDNHYGRFQLSRGKPGLGLRMYASHYNALECFTMFSIAVIVGIVRGIDGHLLANLSILVIIARLFYHIFHAMDFAMARSGIASGLKRLAEFNKALAALPAKATEKQVQELCGLAMEMPDEAYDVVLAITNDIKSVGNRTGASQQQRIKSIISLVDTLLKAKPGRQQQQQQQQAKGTSVDNSYRIYILKSIDDIFIAALKKADQSTHTWLNKVLEMWKEQGNTLLPERILNRLTTMHANVKPQVKSILKGSGGGGSSSGPTATAHHGHRGGGGGASKTDKGDKLVVSFDGLAFAAEVALAERELALIGMIQSKSFKNSKDRKDAMRIHEVRQAAGYLKEGKRKEASKTLSDAKKKYGHLVETWKKKQADAIKHIEQQRESDKSKVAQGGASGDEVMDTAAAVDGKAGKRGRSSEGEDATSSRTEQPPNKKKKQTTEPASSTSSEGGEQHDEIKSGLGGGKIPPGVLGAPPNDLPPMEFSLEWIQHFFTMMSSKIPYHPSHNVLLATKVKTVEQTQEQRVIVDGLSQHELLLVLRFIERLETHIRVQVAETRKMAAAAAGGKKNQGLSQKALAHVQVPHKFRLLHSMGDPSTSGLLDLYFNMPVQCGTCALRFSARQDLLDHHDAHYFKTTMLQRRVKQVEQEYRGWNEAINEWFDNKGTPMLGRDICKALIESVKKAGNVDGDDTASTAATTDTKSAVEETKADHDVEGRDKETARRGFISDAVRLEDMLRHASPYDPVKTKCLECGDELEEEWACEPVDMPVFKGSRLLGNCVIISYYHLDTVVVPVGSAVPVHFLWPGMSSSVKSDKNKADYDESDPEALTVDAAMAGARGKPTRHHEHAQSNACPSDDYRMHNTLYFHRDCWMGNPLLKERDYQQKLLVIESRQAVPTNTAIEEEAPMRDVEMLGAELEGGAAGTRIIVEEGAEAPEGGVTSEEQKALEQRRSDLAGYGRRRKRF